MRLTVLGGCGAWPAAGQACSGYLVEHDGFRLLLDPGYAVVPRLLERIDAADVDAVLVSHSHPDHCADLHPLLRARALRPEPAPALAVHTLAGAVGRVLALDEPETLQGATAVVKFAASDRFEVGPFQVQAYELPHWVPNAGVRLVAGGRVLAYTGDTGPSPVIVELARGADLFLAEASYPLPEQVPARSAGYLSSARQAGADAARAGAGRLVLTHLLPGRSPAWPRPRPAGSSTERSRSPAAAWPPTLDLDVDPERGSHLALLEDVEAQRTAGQHVEQLRARPSALR